MMKFTTLLAMAALLVLSVMGGEQSAISRGAVLNAVSNNRTTPASSPQTTCVPAPSGMVSWWPGEENANDIIGTNHGTLNNGASFAAGLVDQAFSVNGIGAYVEVPNSPSLQISGALSVDCWVYPLPHVGGGIVTNTDNALEGAGWQIGYYGTNLPPGVNPQFVNFTINASFSTYSTLVSPANSVPLYTWTHIAATSDGTTMRLYINGVETGSAPSLPVLASTFTTLLGAYQRNGVKEQFFNGLIDEVEVFNRALSAIEIAAIFNAGSAGKCKFIAVDIDIKPDGFPNSINPDSNGVIPVAILTTPTFNAATVNAGTVRFGANGTEAAPVQTALQDVEGDGDADRILHFRTQSTGITCGATSASLTGQTFSGQAIKGTDSVRTVGCN